jgi:hypothetical protein
MCWRRGDQVIWTNPANGREHRATTVREETFGVSGAFDQPTNSPQEFGGMEVWPGLAGAEAVRLFRIQVEGEEGTRVVPPLQLRPASEGER